MIRCSEILLLGIKKVRKKNNVFPTNKNGGDKLVTQITPKALEILSKKEFGEQVSYDRPFGNAFFNEKAIFDAEDMLGRINEQGFQNRFGEPYANVGDLLYALELEEVGMQTDEDTVEDLWDFIGDCTRCRLCETRNNIVQSEGNTSARLMFVGEAPGKKEDEQGRCFVGPAGQLLTKIIGALGLSRKDVFLSNIVRCRPPENRRPAPDEMATCSHFLIHEIAIIRPLVIVTLGITATFSLLNVNKPFEELRGNFHDFYGTKVLPTYHPAQLLRTPSLKRDTWEDMKLVKDYLEGFA